MNEYRGHGIIETKDEQRGDTYFEVKDPAGHIWLPIFTTEAEARDSIDWEIANA